MRRCASRMASRLGPAGRGVAEVFTGRLLNVVHYGTKCSGLGHAREKMRIVLVFATHDAKIAVTPFLILSAGIPAGGGETMNSRERRIDTRVNIRLPLR